MLPLPSTVQQPAERQHLLRLLSVEDEGLGEELSIVWELEPGVACLEKAQLPPLKDFDPPFIFDAFLDAVAWGSVSNADDKSLQAPFRSGVEVDDYQLDPVVRALSMPRVNLLVADDVGLGKTIEAGLVMQELILRHRARSIIIICPSSIQVQWKEEMRDKFGLDFRIVDSSLLANLRRRRGNVTAVMQELERSIHETLDAKDDKQMQFDWTVEEKQQRERDIGSLTNRLKELPAELSREIEHLRSRYRDPHPRLFPVAVTFLVPPRAIAALQQGGRR
jgi:hypothetical protein